jgi:4-amino-4-deoxy-L-arabinose transferase-like glycosyltransferase
VNTRAPSPLALGFAVFALALLLRVTAIEVTGPERISFGDALDYVAAARSLCESHAYPERGNLPFFRAPGLPFFIAAVTGCHPERTAVIKYALAVADSLSVLAIMAIAAILFSSRRAALIAGVLASLHPLFVGFDTDIRSEPLFMMLLVGALLCALRRRPALAGIALGLASLTRPTGLLAILLLAIFVALYPDRSWRRGAILIAAATLTLLPWTARNAIRFGELIVVNDAAGYTFWRGTRRELMETNFLTDRAEFARRSQEFETRISPEAAKQIDALAPTPASRDRAWRRLAIENSRSDPWFAARATLYRALLYWRPWLHPAEHGRTTAVLSAFLLVPLYVLGVLGLRSCERRMAIAVTVFFVAMWLAHLPYQTFLRIRVPLTDPLLIALAAGWIDRRMPRYILHRAGSLVSAVGGRYEQ